MIPLGKTYATGDEIKEVEKVINGGWWAGAGPTTQALEEEIAKFLELPEGYKVCAVTSGTVALQLCHQYVFKDRRGGVSLVPSYSFVATAFAVNLAGGRPQFIDVDYDYVNIDPEAIEKYIDFIPFPLSVSPVHQYGIPCNLDAIQEIADKRGLVVIEDAACAFGSKYKGKYIGSHGNLTCFSLHARKTATCGEGGFIVIPPHIDANWFYSMRNFGMDKSPFQKHGKDTSQMSYVGIGLNGKMSDILAGVALAQVRRFDEILAARSYVAEKYNNLLYGIPEVGLLKIPEDCETSWQNYRITVDPFVRDRLMSFLKNKGIMTKKCIQPIHKEEVYKDQAKFNLERTEFISSAGVWLPFYAEMDDEVDIVCNAIREFFYV